MKGGVAKVKFQRDGVGKLEDFKIKSVLVAELGWGRLPGSLGLIAQSFLIQ